MENKYNYNVDDVLNLNGDVVDSKLMRDYKELSKLLYESRIYQLELPALILLGGDWEKFCNYAAILGQPYCSDPDIKSAIERAYREYLSL